MKTLLWPCGIMLLALGFAAAPADDRNEAAFTNSWSIRLGETISACRAKIRWSDVKTKEFLESSPFVYTLSFIDPESAAIWTEPRPKADPWEHSLIAVFSDADKQTVVDFFEVIKGHHHPLVAGRYQRALQGIAPGDNVRDLYKTLGRQRCDYELDSKGRWRVIFTYTGLRGRLFQIHADAATGTVLEVHDVTI